MKRILFYMGLALINVGVLSTFIPSKQSDSVVHAAPVTVKQEPVNPQPEVKPETPQPVEVKETPAPVVQEAPKPTPVVTGSCEDWMQQAGISADDMVTARILINRESNCRINATNPSSGAYGIAQALPASKYASEGSDWATNPVTQLRWMDRYVMNRYGSWDNALAFHYRNHWY